MSFFFSGTRPHRTCHGSPLFTFLGDGCNAGLGTHVVLHLFRVPAACRVPTFPGSRTMAMPRTNRKKKKKNTQPLDCAHEKTRGGRIPCHGRDPAHLHSHDELPRTGHGVHYAKLPCTLPGIPQCFVLREPSCGGLKYGAREHIKQFIRIKARPGQVPLAVVCLGEEPPTLRYLPRPRPGTRLANRIDVLNVGKGSMAECGKCRANPCQNVLCDGAPTGICILRFAAAAATI